ncbi:hypothetical protein CU098_000328, partial [Rhizopus stolonifer]
SLVAVGLGGLLSSMYLDAKYLFSKDINQIRIFLSTLFNLRSQESQGKAHWYNIFKDRAKKEPNGLFLMFEGKEYTFRQVEKASNKLAHYLLTQDIKKGDVVCIMLQNHPTFFITLFAISKIGALPSFVNTNLVDQSLLHCVKIASSKMFIFDPIYEQQVSAIMDQCPGIIFVAYGESTEEYERSPLPFAQTLTPSALNTFPDSDTDEALIKGRKLTDPAYLIYTSGTTGLPKPAIVQHIRILAIVSFSSTLARGGVIVLGRKFSASRFWNDCVEYKVDLFTYIGEFCRYLLSQPPHPEERNHKVRAIFGNGIRVDVWKPFQE